jgi:hypothetical protein
MRRIGAVVVTGLLLGALGFAISPASAATPPCQGQGTDYTGTIIVPAGTTCYLQGGTITGSVIVQPGGRLVTGSGTHITGSVSADRAGSDTANLLGNGPFSFSVVMCNTIVDGSVSVTRSTDHVLIGDDLSPFGCGSNRIGGNVTLTGNTQGVILDNDPTSCPIGACGIGGSVTVSNNTGTTLDDVQSAEVANNVIKGALSCFGNQNGVIGGNNTAASKSGQCAAL